MKPIEESPDRTLEWAQRGSRPHSFELVSTAGVHGALRWEPGRGLLAVGRAATGAWTLKRVGFLQPRITVRAVASGTTVAVFTPRLAGGVLELADGRCFDWHRKGLWSPQWTFSKPDGSPLLRYRASTGVAAIGAVVEIEDERLVSSTPFLVLTGWYLIVLTHEDEEMAALTTIVLAGS